MKKILLIISLSMLLFSCEQINVDLTNEDIENQLKTMVGEKISSVGNTLKSEGFQKIKIEEQINYVKGKETYIFITKNKTVVSAGYQTNDSIKTYKILDKYHYSFEKKGIENYLGEIYSTNFKDWSKSYVDSIKISNNQYSYIYDNPVLFYSTLQVNMFNLIFASESWWEGEKNSGEMWNIQLGEKSKTVCITYSDFSIEQ